MWVSHKMHGLFHGKAQSKMNDDWGYSHDETETPTDLDESQGSTEYDVTGMMGKTPRKFSYGNNQPVTSVYLLNQSNDSAMMKYSWNRTVKMIYFYVFNNPVFFMNLSNNGNCLQGSQVAQESLLDEKTSTLQ